MTKLFKILAAIAVMAVMSIGNVNAQNSNKVDGTPHNLLNYGGADTYLVGGNSAGLVNDEGRGQDMCRYCHAPHNTDANIPLWNHTMSGETFAMYSSGSMKNATGSLSGVSLGCLSCHDGVTAMDAIVGYTITGGSMGVMTSTTRKIGTSLGDDHPVNVRLAPGVDVGNGTLLAAEYNTPSNGLINTLPLFDTVVTDTFDTVECATCHSVHNNTNGYFLRLDPAGGDLCGSCHNK